MGDVVMERRRMMMGSTGTVARYIEDGLVFWLDGINKGNSTTNWVDLIGGVTFNVGSAKLSTPGYVQFNGSDVYTASSNVNYNVSSSTIEVCISNVNNTNAAGSAFYGPQDKSISFWIRRSSSSKYIGCSVGTYGNTGYNTKFLDAVPPTTIICSMTENRGVLNGNVLTNFTKSNWGATGKTYIGGRLNGSSKEYGLTGRIHSIRIYNRILTNTEMEYNQNADKERFGL